MSVRIRPSIRRLLRAGLPIALAAVVLGAPSLAQAAADPAAAFRDFASALNAGREDEAWNLLSEGTRFELTNAARRAAEAEGKPPPKDGRRIAFGSGLALQRRIASVTVAERTDDRARIVVTDEAGETQSVMTVREGGKWRVDFTEELRGLPAR